MVDSENLFLGILWRLVEDRNLWFYDELEEDPAFKEWPEEKRNGAIDDFFHFALEGKFMYMISYNPVTVFLMGKAKEIVRFHCDLCSDEYGDNFEFCPVCNHEEGKR